MIHVYDDFTRLREIIIGQPNIIDFNELINMKNKSKAQTDLCLIQENYLKTLAEMNEDVNVLIKVLHSFDVNIKRPSIYKSCEDAHLNIGKSNMSSPRDLLLIVDNCIIETCSELESNNLQLSTIQDIAIYYMNMGSVWIKINNFEKINLFIDDSEYSIIKYKVGHEFTEGKWSNINKKSILLEHKSKTEEYFNNLTTSSFLPVFDAAQCLKLGKYIFFNIVKKHHISGYKWLKYFFGDKFNIIPCCVSNKHLDGAIVPLRPGLLLLNRTLEKKVNELIPKQFKNWDKIFFQKDENFTMYSADTPYLLPGSVNVNVLSIDEENVIIDECCKHDLGPLLEKYKINPIPLRLRHKNEWGGSFHCITNDTIRDGGLIDYFK